VPPRAVWRIRATAGGESLVGERQGSYAGPPGAGASGPAGANAGEPLPLPGSTESQPRLNLKAWMSVGQARI